MPSFDPSDLDPFDLDPPDPFALRKQARSRLYADLPTYIAAPFCVAVCVLGVLFAGSAVLSLADMYLYLDNVTYLLFELLILLVTVITAVPLLYGLCVLFQRSASGKSVRLTDLFYAFGSFSLFARSFCLFWAMLWRFLLCFAVSLFFLWEAEAYRGGYNLVTWTPIFWHDIDLTALALCSLCYLSAIFMLTQYASYFVSVRLAVLHEDQSVSKCFAAGHFCVRCSGGKKDFGDLSVSFWLLLLLSVLSCGILFVIYTLPYMLLSFFMLAEATGRDELNMHYATTFFK